MDKFDKEMSLSEILGFENEYDLLSKGTKVCFYSIFSIRQSRPTGASNTKTFLSN